MIKRFSWKEGDLHSIKLKNDLYIISQLLAKPYAAFFSVVSKKDFCTSNNYYNLNNENPLIVTMMLNSFFKQTSVGRIKNKNIENNKNIVIPTRFISKDKGQYGVFMKDEELIYNIVEIDPNEGDQGIMGNKIIERNITSDSQFYNKCELTGYNTGYEFVRRLLLSLEYKKPIDPLKEIWFHGSDPYSLKTVQEMWDIGVPKYE
ncbi:hypothetical protein [Marinomonas sp. 2405UD68-3]|uniref:hypothetical protein n=1 Tax=Marinomonas sp. 2405UD68-3 TaxID=3391835 RepID=UPI0039C8E176